MVVWVLDGLSNALRLIGNLLIRLRGPAADYVVVTLSGRYPERSIPPRPLLQRMLSASWRRHEESLEALRVRLDRVAGDPRVRGIVIRIHDLEAGAATVQSLRDALTGLRSRGKRLVAYLLDADLRSYHLAAAADEIIARSWSRCWTRSWGRSSPTWPRRGAWLPRPSARQSTGRL